jgi:hypothetical protein
MDTPQEKQDLDIPTMLTRYNGSFLTALSGSIFKWQVVYGIVSTGEDISVIVGHPHGLVFRIQLI